ncbi:hypothetical protein MPNE_0062 [Mycoplasmoides pneumoniae FH]|uniref:Uncharacterized protein n=1 Tax=Mycoplasmoides pneumoniae (strain ATCC 15531 / DSM 23978 / CIP 103766 / NBRC 14401 / NCTC 10119 / FH) TaxID=722438 RepID=A0A0H3DQ32_MYCPB|nr:hypothetical protein MPNE_0062 [Mycoplasmoides pneumoniae FH]
MEKKAKRKFLGKKRAKSLDKEKAIFWLKSGNFFNKKG